MALQLGLQAGVKSQDEGLLRIKTEPAAQGLALRVGAAERSIPLAQADGTEIELISPAGALDGVLAPCALSLQSGTTDLDRRFDQMECISEQVQDMVGEMRTLLAEEKAFLAQVRAAVKAGGPLARTLKDLRDTQAKIVAFVDKALAQWRQIIPSMFSTVDEFRGLREDFLDAQERDPEGARAITSLEEISETATARIRDSYIPLADRALYELVFLETQRGPRHEATELLFEAGGEAQAAAERALAGWKKALDSWERDIGDDQGGLLGAISELLFGKGGFTKLLVAGGITIGGIVLLSRLAG